MQKNDTIEIKQQEIIKNQSSEQTNNSNNINICKNIN